MKRFTKVRRILALSLVLAMAFGGTVLASDSNTALVNATYQQLASRGTYTYTNASELSRFVQLGYACNQPQHQGPFSITQGTLTTKKWLGKKSSKAVYVIALSGTDTDVKNQSTGYWTDLLVGFEQDNKCQKRYRFQRSKGVQPCRYRTQFRRYGRTAGCCGQHHQKELQCLKHRDLWFSFDQRFPERRHRKTSG